MTFKKFDEQQVFQVSCLNASGLELEVGDMITHNPATNEVAHITKASEAKQAKNDGLSIYIIAQSDDVTNKVGTAYKTYAVGTTVKIGETAKIVACYRVLDIESVEGYAAE